MPKAYDRVKNADNRSDVFIKTPYWTPDTEIAFEKWAATHGEDCLADVLGKLLDDDIAISFKALDGSICCTLAHQPSKLVSLPYLLTGWSDSVQDALWVSIFKLEVQLDGVFAEQVQAKPSKRH